MYPTTKRIWWHFGALQLATPTTPLACHQTMKTAIWRVYGTKSHATSTIKSMEISWNRGTPKSSILIGFSWIFLDKPFWDTPMTMETTFFLLHWYAGLCCFFSGTATVWQQMPPKTYGGVRHVMGGTPSHDPVMNPKFDCWLVVSTPLKNISQWEGLSHILWKIKNVWNHQPDCFTTETWMSFGVHHYHVWHVPSWPKAQQVMGPKTWSGFTWNILEPNRFVWK